MTFPRAALLALAALGADSAPPPDPAPPAPGPAAADRQGLTARLLEAPVATRTKDGTRGDPLNVALVGTREEMLAAFAAAGWSTADPITLRSSVGIAVSVALNVPYPQAPLSDLYLWCRRQDLALERPCGRSARMRHHARFWCAGPGPDGRPVWLGADTFNARVGRSARTGRVTHHIEPDVDRERDFLMANLREAGQLCDSFLLPRTGPRRDRNGEWDCYFTDGAMAVGALRVGGACGQCAAPVRATGDGDEALPPSPAPGQ